ncbi:hypothetical protein IPdc08_01003 [archaeon]|nr:hypothetical protein IPdc08_01003 [archaeon]
MAVLIVEKKRNEARDEFLVENLKLSHSLLLKAFKIPNNSLLK